MAVDVIDTVAGNVDSGYLRMHTSSWVWGEVAGRVEVECPLKRLSVGEVPDGDENAGAGDFRYNLSTFVVEADTADFAVRIWQYLLYDTVPDNFNRFVGLRALGHNLGST